MSKLLKLVEKAHEIYTEFEASRYGNSLNLRHSKAAKLKSILDNEAKQDQIDDTLLISDILKLREDEDIKSDSCLYLKNLTNILTTLARMKLPKDDTNHLLVNAADSELQEYLKAYEKLFSAYKSYAVFRNPVEIFIGIALETQHLENLAPENKALKEQIKHLHDNLSAQETAAGFTKEELTKALAKSQEEVAALTDELQKLKEAKLGLDALLLESAAREVNFNKQTLLHAEEIKSLKNSHQKELKTKTSALEKANEQTATLANALEVQAGIVTEKDIKLNQLLQEKELPGNTPNYAKVVATKADGSNATILGSIGTFSNPQLRITKLPANNFKSGYHPPSIKRP